MPQIICRIFECMEQIIFIHKRKKTIFKNTQNEVSCLFTNFAVHIWIWRLTYAYFLSELIELTENEVQKDANNSQQASTVQYAKNHEASDSSPKIEKGKKWTIIDDFSDSAYDCCNSIKTLFYIFYLGFIFLTIAISILKGNDCGYDCGSFWSYFIFWN